MPTKDGFAPGHPLPRFLSEHADEPGRLRVAEAWNRTGISSRVVLTTRALIGMATAIGILTVEDPVALFTTSLLEISALLPAIGQSTAAIQSTSDLENLPPTISDAPTRGEIAAALEPADQSQIKINPPSTEDLFKQFQTWAVAEDKRAKVEPAPPVQDAPEQVVQDAPTKSRDHENGPKSLARPTSAGRGSASAKFPKSPFQNLIKGYRAFVA
jgi:hypothetical protein